MRRPASSAARAARRQSSPVPRQAAQSPAAVRCGRPACRRPSRRRARHSPARRQLARRAKASQAEQRPGPPPAISWTWEPGQASAVCDGSIEHYGRFRGGCGSLASKSPVGGYPPGSVAAERPGVGSTPRGGAGGQLGSSVAPFLKAPHARCPCRGNNSVCWPARSQIGLDCGSTRRRRPKDVTLEHDTLFASKSRPSSCRGQDQRQDPPRRTDCRFGAGLPIKRGSRAAGRPWDCPGETFS